MHYYYVNQERPSDPTDSPLLVAFPSPAREALPIQHEAPAPAVIGDPEDPDGDSSNEEKASASVNDDPEDGKVDNNQWGGPEEIGPRRMTYTSENDTDTFPRLLKDVLRRLGNYERLLYVTIHIIDPLLEDYYTTEVHIWETVENFDSMRTYTAHESATPHGTYVANISTAARRALSALYYDFSSELGDTDYRRLPHRHLSTENDLIVLGDIKEDRLNTLAGYTAALRMDHEASSLSWSRCAGNLRSPRIRLWSCGTPCLS